MTPDDGKTLITRFSDDGGNANNLDEPDGLVTGAFLDPQAISWMPPGCAGKQIDVMFRTAMADAWFTVDDIMTDGHGAAARRTSTGTHQGDLFGISPTGKAVKVTTTVVYRTEDGRLAEGWITPGRLWVHAPTWCHPHAEVAQRTRQSKGPDGDRRQQSPSAASVRLHERRPRCLSGGA